jgi:ATP-binding cassette, subfamily B, bacterial PglK
MKNIFKYFNEILFILGESRYKLPGLTVLFLVMSSLEVLGIGLIAPYVGLVVTPDMIVEGNFQTILGVFGLSTERNELLISLGFILVAVFTLKTMGAIYINYRIIKFCEQQRVRIRTHLMNAYQNFSYTEYINRNSSEYIFTILDLSAKFTQSVLVASLKSLSDGFVIIVLFIFLGYKNPSAMIIFVSFILILILGYDRVFRNKLHKFGQLGNKAVVKMLQGIHEGIEGLKEIRILGKENYFYKKVQKGAEESSRYSIKSQTITVAPRYLLELLMITFVVVLVLVTLLTDGNLQDVAPTLGMFGVAALRLLPAFNTISNSLAQLRLNRDGVSRLQKDLAFIDKVKPQKQTEAKKSIPASNFETLIFDNVRFNYPNATLPALNGLSLKIYNGETIGFIGSSGSGKTTLVDVMLGLLEAGEGKVLYNEMSINSSLNIWRSQVAYIPQQVFLIDNTLRRNIALGIEDSEISEEILFESIRQASLMELVNQLPLGVDTVLGERGVRISGGQRQRVALARAFYHNRNVIIMDEATSALDHETELEIISEIKRLKGLKTMIVIAHRLNTLQHCDRIYRLHKGCIVEVGPPEKILRE